MTNEVATTPTTDVEVPEVTRIIAPPGNFALYMHKLLKAAEESVAEAQQKLAKAEQWENSEEITEAQQAINAAEQLGGDEGYSQLRRWQYELKSRQQKKRVRLARSKHTLESALCMKEALEAGYVPLPRMPAVNMDSVRQTMPPDVLYAFSEAKEAGVFEEFRVIDGREANRYGRPTGTAHKDRDPILVGMIGREMFAIAWWR